VSDNRHNPFSQTLDTNDGFYPQSILQAKGKTRANMSDQGKHKRWFPLESNPDVMNAYVEKMGFPTAQFSFCDVMSTEEWALGMVPKPVVAVIMLFPIKPHVRRSQSAGIVRLGGLLTDGNAAVDGGGGQAGGRETGQGRPSGVAQRLLHAPDRWYGGFGVMWRQATSFYLCYRPVGNACGTVGILHAIGNMRHLVQLSEWQCSGSCCGVFH
jgi:hypothetical protein